MEPGGRDLGRWRGTGWGWERARGGGGSVEVLAKIVQLHNYALAQELCDSRGGHPGLPVLNSPYGLCGRKKQH